MNGLALCSLCSSKQRQANIRRDKCLQMCSLSLPFGAYILKYLFCEVDPALSESGWPVWRLPKVDENFKTLSLEFTNGRFSSIPSRGMAIGCRAGYSNTPPQLAKHHSLFKIPLLIRIFKVKLHSSLPTRRSRARKIGLGRLSHRA